jgi:hypothetical protein
MIKLSRTHLTALVTATALGIGTVAVPSAALASSHATKAKVTRHDASSGRDRSGHDSSSGSDPQSPDASSSPDGSLDR